jgi:hypothetical protein
MSFINPKSIGASGTGQTFTSISGARATSNVGASAAIREVQQAMLEFEPYQTPILTKLMSTKLGKKPTGNQKFEWINSSLMPMVDTLTTALTGGGTTESSITPGDVTLYQVGTKFVVDATGDVFIVTAVTSTINLTKIGSGNDTATSTGTTIHFIGNSFEQGSSSATAKSVNKNFPYNYVEIFKEAVQETESQQATVEYGPVDWDRNKAARMREFKMKVERALIHGVRGSATGVQNGSFTQYFSGGVYDTVGNFISTSYAFSGTVPTEPWFYGTFLKGLFAKGTNKKRLYAGADLIQSINDFSKVKALTRIGETEYGVDLQKIFCPFGTLELVWHPMLDGLVFSKQGFAIDYGMGDTIKYRYLSGNGKNRDLQFRDYTDYYKQADSRKGEWLGEVGMQIDGDEYHGTILPQAT